jgi:hypothetical protein
MGLNLMKARHFLLQERERMLHHFQDLKSQMNCIRDCEREKLTKLTLESTAAIKELKRQKEKVSS